MDTLNTLFNGHKTNCKRRCKSWFSLQPELERACKNLCKTGRTEFTKDEFLCKEGVVDEEVLIFAYGYDPCEGGKDIEEVLDPLDSKGEVERKFERYNSVMGVGVILLLISILAMIIILRK